MMTFKDIKTGETFKDMRFKDGDIFEKLEFFNWARVVTGEDVGSYYFADNSPVEIVK
jgi:hypothetical protein